MSNAEKLKALKLTMDKIDKDYGKGSVMMMNEKSQDAMEVISTGYMLIDGGVQTTVSYMSNTVPIPADKPEIALCTAWAGEMQGNHVIYMDAGSGAQNPVSAEMIQKVSKHLLIPLIVGGGISTPQRVYENCKAGANIIVVGNAIERDVMLIKDLAAATRK